VLRVNECEVLKNASVIQGYFDAQRSFASAMLSRARRFVVCIDLQAFAEP